MGGGMGGEGEVVIEEERGEGGRERDGEGCHGRWMEGGQGVK